MPLSATERVGFDAFVDTVIVPEVLPAVVGVKVAVNDALAPGAIVCPALRPVALNAAPEVLMELTVTLAVPEFLSVIVCVLLLPISTLLKL